jgi:2-methylcitrate synthase
MSSSPPASEIKRGLEGVVVDTTAVSQVTSETSSLIYRGYPVQQLAEHCNFEEVAYLVLNGELPNRQQLEQFTQQERSQRVVDAKLIDFMRQFPSKAHPMDVIQTAISWLGMADPTTADTSAPAQMKQAINLLAKSPTIVAAAFRIRKGEQPISPRTDVSYSENFFHMCFGKIPQPQVVKAFDVSMILYAEHSFNASTFTARVITSTLSDLYSSITGAVGALKGPLHGGANEEVMHMLKEISEPAKARQWVLDALVSKRKIMGFGHRVYKHGDSRAPTMQKYGLQMAQVTGDTRWHDISAEVEKTMIEQKKIYPNLDFPAGPIYYLMGFDIDFFTPFFAMARIAGWSAHIIEQNASNRLIRPLSQYTGQAERKVVPMAQRS